MADDGRIGSGRAVVYQALAETLSPEGPPVWMTLEGRAWPLFKAILSLHPPPPSARRAIRELQKIARRSIKQLEDSHSSLFTGSLINHSILYESAWVNGHPMGPEMFQVERLYHAAGLEIVGAELADHASLELAFLAYLTEEGERELERNFIRQHAGRWLPALGRRLFQSGDPVYAPVGALLTGWIEEAERLLPITTPYPVGCDMRPSIPKSEACTLCGFCVQACPTRSLLIVENDTTTMLILYPESCRSCGHCQKACEFGAISLAARQDTSLYPGEEAIFLHSSPRASCSICGSSLVSQAEMDFVRQTLGDPLWLDFCQDCRSSAVL
jgi:TorA maturation chaperone TorD/Pyruvate/2-oxoacid:ferredoxin oxidoreductase delta subunit